MIKTKNSFYIGVAILLVIFYLLEFALIKIGKGNYISPYYWSIHAFLVALTLFTHRIAAKGLLKRNDFHLYAMGSMTIRMLAALIFIVAFVFYLTDNQEVFVINFIVAYFTYTGFEIYYLLANLRPDSEKK
jgi:hypothetical protein